MSPTALAWLVLVLAGGLECAWVIGLKYAEGFTRLVPSVVTVIAIAGSLGGLSFALRVLPTGTAYAIWTGIGAAGVALLGILFFGESVSPLRLVSIALVVCGVAGLRLAA